MKRLLALILVLSLIVSLSACGVKIKYDDTSGDRKESASKSDKDDDNESTGHTHTTEPTKDDTDCDIGMDIENLPTDSSNNDGEIGFDDLISPPITSLKLSPSSATLYSLGATILLSVTTEPAGQNYDITFESDDPTIATVDQTGKVVAVGRGVTIITASCENLTATCLIACDFQLPEPEPEPDPVYEESDLTFKDFGYGNTATFPLSWGSVRLYNGKIPADKVTFASNDEAVATVDAEGMVTFVGVGRALITATYGEWTITFVLRISDS